jgi:hypothetical protein
MTVALRQPVAQATLPRSRLASASCESVREWLVTARGCLKRPQAGALQQQRRGWPALPRRAVRRGQNLTIQLLANRDGRQTLQVRRQTLRK